MDAPTFAAIESNARYMIDELRKALGGALSLRDQGAAWHELSGHYRMLGIAGFWLSCDPERFRQPLRSSAGARIRLLALTPRSELDSYHYGSSRVEALFDALASGDDDSAERIAASSPTEHFEDFEDDSDWAYAQFVHILTRDPDADATAVEPALSTFEESLLEPTTTRFEICSALTDRDSEAFAEAFADLVAERDAHNEERRAKLVLDPHREKAEASIFVEGLALLRLASRRGLEIPPTEHESLPVLLR